MPYLVKVSVVQARGLPASEFGKSSQVVLDLADNCLKSEPTDHRWDFTSRLEIDDDEALLQDPLRVRVLGHGGRRSGASEVTVVLPLESLVTRALAAPADSTVDIAPRLEGAASPPAPPPDSMGLPAPLFGGANLAGWFPAMDSLDGVVGEVWLEVTLRAFSSPDWGKVDLFTSSFVDPAVFPQVWVRGFVEELVVGHDPEYGLADSFRTSRASNQRRQLQLTRMGQDMRLRIRHKAAEVGANAVLGFTEDVDVEGDSGVVVRGYGTAVRL
ncbi:c2cd5, partial [Symbiodinium sp. KB8]